MSSLKNAALQYASPLGRGGPQGGVMNLNGTTATGVNQNLGQVQSATNANASQANTVPTGMPAPAQAQLAPQVQGNSAIQALAQAANGANQQSALQQQAQQLQQQQAMQRQQTAQAIAARDNAAIANGTMSPGQGLTPQQQYAQWLAAQPPPSPEHVFNYTAASDASLNGINQGPGYKQAAGMPIGNATINGPNQWNAGPVFGGPSGDQSAALKAAAAYRLQQGSPAVAQGAKNLGQSIGKRQIQ